MKLKNKQTKKQQLKIKQHRTQSAKKTDEIKHNHTTTHKIYEHQQQSNTINKIKQHPYK